MKIIIDVIDIPDGDVTDPICHRSWAAHCLHQVAEFFEARPVDNELSGTVGRIGQNIINWTIEGVQQ